MERDTCPQCGGHAEFVQFADGSETTTQTTADEVGDDILELRCCDGCGAGIENILSLRDQTVVTHEVKA
jgi:uncharacterized protein YuzB (UPF0349 family)